MCRRTVDTVITVAVTAATVIPLLLPAPRAWWVVGLGFLAAVPVLWRRRAPVLAGIIVGVAQTLLVLWEKPLLPYGPLVAFYTISAIGSARVRVLAVPFTVAAVALSLVLPGERAEEYRWVGTAFVAAWALGAGARARAARRAELAERELRLAQERAAAVARERTRIARDMHDIVTHSVGLMVLQAETGPLVLRSAPERAAAAFDSIADTGRGALTELRGLLTALRSPEGSGEPQPRLDTLPDLIGRSGLEVTLTGEGEARPVSAAVEVAAYRIVQEALTNVRKHARTSAARVHLTWTPSRLAVEIADDGAGPRPAEPGGGQGIVGMRERASAAGGDVAAGTGPRGGFVVRATFPVL